VSAIDRAGTIACERLRKQNFNRQERVSALKRVAGEILLADKRGECVCGTKQDGLGIDWPISLYGMREY
jgi:hypothetical protein